MMKQNKLLFIFNKYEEQSEKKHNQQTALMIHNN